MRYTELGNLIRQFWERLGLGQGALATALQIGQQTDSQWENGRLRPERDMVDSLVKIFHIEIDPILAAGGYELSKPVHPLLKRLPLASLIAEDFELFCRDLFFAYGGLFIPFLLQ